MVDHLAHLIHSVAREHSSRPAMRVLVDDVWQSTSYAEVIARVRSLAAYILSCDIKPGDKIAVFSPNRPEWAIADHAIHTVGAVSVPLYATSNRQQVEHILKDSGARMVFVADAKFAERVPWETLPDLCYGVSFDPVTDPHYKTYVDVLAEPSPQANSKIDECLATATSADIATIIYTSGTTGEPKGVVLSHGAFCHQLRAVSQRFTVTETDRSLCVLPLSHAFERSWSYLVMSKGAEIIYVLDPREIAPVLPVTRPTCMVGVPRLFEKVMAAALAKAGESGAKRRLFDWCIRVGQHYQHRKYAHKRIRLLTRIRHLIAQRLVLSKIQTAFGGPKQVVACGGAPLRADVAEFFLAFGVVLCEGYGLTESAPMLTCNWHDAFRFGTVGKPVAEVEIQIAADGEILARGPNIMAGYHNLPVETAEALQDGWLHTGDVGEFDDDGFLTITDRIKDLIVTSTGKNIAPAPIEGRLMADPFIEQAIVIGDQRSYLTALIQPAYESLEEWARKAGLAFENRESLLRMPHVVTMFNERVRQLTHDLMNHERVRRITLLSREITMESGLLTPTLKVRRKQAAQVLGPEIDQMYERPHIVPADKGLADPKTGALPAETSGTPGTGEPTGPSEQATKAGS